MLGDLMNGVVSSRCNGFDGGKEKTEYYKDRECQYDFIHKVAPLFVEMGRLYLASLKETLSYLCDCEFAMLLIFRFVAIFVPKNLPDYPQ